MAVATVLSRLIFLPRASTLCGGAGATSAAWPCSSPSSSMPWRPGQPSRSPDSCPLPPRPRTVGSAGGDSRRTCMPEGKLDDPFTRVPSVPAFPGWRRSIRVQHQAILDDHFPARKPHAKPQNALHGARNPLPARMLVRSDPGHPGHLSFLACRTGSFLPVTAGRVCIHPRPSAVSAVQTVLHWPCRRPARPSAWQPAFRPRRRASGVLPHRGGKEARTPGTSGSAPGRRPPPGGPPGGCGPYRATVRA